MRSTVRATLMLPLIAAVAACAVQPRLDRDGLPPFDGGRTIPLPGDATDETVAERDLLRPPIDRVCRTAAMPAGYIAIDYAAAGRDCPQLATGEDRRFNAAVIERYTSKQVGATMVVCADQPLPSGWLSQREGGGTTACRGARVSEGEPTTHLIVRVRAPAD